jgi:hypothetical protein
MLNLPAPETSEYPGTAGCRGITIPGKPCSPGSKFPGTIVGRRSIRGPESELREMSKLQWILIQSDHTK